MNDRQRFLATMQFQPHDRCPMWDFGFWKETLALWHAEGLPDTVDTNAKAARYFGMDDFDARFEPQFELLPEFPRETVRENDQYRWVRRADGVVEMWLKQGTAIPEPSEYLLTGRETWPEYKRRLNPADPARVPADFAQQVARYADATRTGPISIWAGSLYGELRNWIGVEALSLMLYDDRLLVEEMVELRAECILQPLARALEIARGQGVTFDYAAMWEDICFNRGPLIAPKMFSEIAARHYRRITDLLASYGCRVVQLDCDGKIDDLVSIWLENGVNLMFPIEIGDWADPMALRRRWGRNMLLRGGFDKHILARGPDAIREEIRRLTPLVEEGGYIPHCDHRVPADVSMAQYVFYVNEAKRVWGRGLPNLRPIGQV